MILITILAIIAVLLVIATVLFVSIFGTVGIIVFGDVIVCIVLIGFFIKWLINRRR